MFLISFSIPIFHNSIPLSKMAESRINIGFADKRNFHVLQDALQLGFETIQDEETRFRMKKLLI